MKVLHLNVGAETGGGMIHILQLLKNFKKADMTLGLFEKGMLFDQASRAGIKIELFKQKSRLDLSIIPKIIQYIEENQIDIVHTHGPRANIFGYLLKRKQSNYKWIITLHSNPHLDFMGRGYKGYIFTKLHLWSLKKPDHYLAISDRFKELLLDKNISPHHITTIYNGIDFSDSVKNATLTRAAFEVQDSDFVIIMVARLDPVKGHIDVFHALLHLLNKYTHIKLFLIGDGVLDDELKEKAKSMGLQSHVIFLGYRVDVPPLYRLGDLFLLSSYSESFPLVLLEAAKEKLPVITTDVGGVKELIPNDRYGWVVPVKNRDKLQQAIEEAIILKEKQMLHLKGSALYNRAATFFTVERFRDSVYDCYKKIMS